MLYLLKSLFYWNQLISPDPVIISSTFVLILQVLSCRYLFFPIVCFSNYMYEHRSVKRSICIFCCRLDSVHILSVIIEFHGICIHPPTTVSMEIFCRWVCHIRNHIRTFRRIVSTFASLFLIPIVSNYCSSAYSMSCSTDYQG
jgi:hypothetical protein